MVLFFILFIYSILSQECDDETCLSNESFYKSLALSLLTPATFDKIKKPHDKIEFIRDQVPTLKFVSTYSDPVGILDISELDNYITDIKEKIGYDMNYPNGKLPLRISKSIDRQFRQAKYMKKNMESYIDLQLSGEWGGKQKLTYGVIGFVRDKNNKNNIHIGASLLSQKWEIDDKVRLKLEKLDNDDWEKYIQFELFKKVFKKLAPGTIKGITTADINKKTYYQKKKCETEKTHIILISDKSGSMGSDDRGTSTTEYEFIRNFGGFKNRLGALFSSIEDLIQFRSDNNCNDVISCILFDSTTHPITDRLPIDREYVSNYLLKKENKPYGGTNFGGAFNYVNKNNLINENEKTIVIFLTDGQASDGGSTNIVSEWSKKMKDKLSLYCVVLGKNSPKVVENICQSGNGQMKKALNGQELPLIYNEIAYFETR